MLVKSPGRACAPLHATRGMGTTFIYHGKTDVESKRLGIVVNTLDYRREKASNVIAIEMWLVDPLRENTICYWTKKGVPTLFLGGRLLRMSKAQTDVEEKEQPDRTVDHRRLGIQELSFAGGHLHHPFTARL
jgi:hypothetical protein